MLVWEAEIVSLLITFDLIDEHVQAIRVILNPDKLAYIKRQLEAQLA